MSLDLVIEVAKHAIDLLSQREVEVLRADRLAITLQADEYDALVEQMQAVYGASERVVTDIQVCGIVSIRRWPPSALGVPEDEA